MNYPNGPYGPGWQGQQPGYQPPQWGNPQQPYGPPPAPPATPSATTGIIAGVLAGLGGLANLVGGILMAIGLAVITNESTYGDDAGWTVLIAIVVLNIIAGVLLSVGTVMLLLRKMIGRWLVVAGCAVSIVSSLISIGVSTTVALYQYGGVGTNVVGLVFPIATLVLVLLPSTTAWIQAKQKTAPPPPYYPPPAYPPYRG